MRRSISTFTVTLFTVSVMAVFIAGYCGTANAGNVFVSNWANSSVSKESFLKEGKGVLTKAKFSELSLGALSVSGTRGVYHALVRLIPEKNIVFICVMGPDVKECERFANYMRANGLW